MAGFLPVPSIDKDALTLGPAARLLYARSDVLGNLRYRFDEKREHSLAFGKKYAEWNWAVIDLVRTAAFFHPPSHRLQALADYISLKPVTYLFGSQWGKIIEGTEEARKIQDPLDAISKARMPVFSAETGHRLGLRLCANPHFSELYTLECQRILNPERSNVIEIFFDIPSGEFIEGHISVQDRKTQAMLRREKIYNFPLTWHNSPHLDLTPEHSRKIKDQAREKEIEAIRQEFYAGQKRGKMRNRVFKASASSPIPRTTHLKPKDAVKEIANAELEYQFLMVQENLEKEQPDRTYLILGQFADIVADCMRHWPIEKTARVLASQPAPLLAPVMSLWSLQRILEVIHSHPDKEYLNEWLRDREVERLLDSNHTRSPANAEEAREWLGFEQSPDSRMIKRHWRMLAGFLNTDFGRQTESSIHRRKDEVAKRLQEARDILQREI